MKQSWRFRLLFPAILIFLTLGGYTLLAWTVIPVASDPLVRMPGTQPGEVTNLEGPNRCLNCHSGYDEAVEPGSNWMGSMMAQASRDFLFWAGMTVAGQDSIWVLDNPNAADLCERCHFPQGWLEGRSDPPNASEMTGVDYDGVHCDVCHNLYDPLFEATHNRAREGDLDGNGIMEADEWQAYWDETNLSDTPSAAAAATTYAANAVLTQTITLFNGQPFFGPDNLPVSPNYTENGGGQYFVSPAGEKRASFADATGRHDMLYSRYHKSKYYCGTCHDVSNPALANLGQDGSTPLTSETEPAYAYYHIERTFSEFILSDYGQEGGSPGIGPYAPDAFTTSHPNNAIATCQDCHMPDAVGTASSMSDAVVRPDGSVEHPQSGQPVHDLTGGNLWVGYVLASAVPKSPNHDPVNETLLDQGPAALTLDLSEGDGLDPVAILRGVDRAQQQLLQAAAIEDLTYDPESGAITFRVQNRTGHKLISGFPEGRRMFVGIRAYAGDTLIREINPYDGTAGTLKGLPAEYSPNSPPLSPGESRVDELVYEMHPSSSHTGEDQTFHMVLSDGRHKDNRIPPKGFRIDDAADRLSEPVWEGAPAPEYFSAEEYAGGYDAVDLTDYEIWIPGADNIEVSLYYQTTSREFIEFLRSEINGTASTLPETAYVIQSDPFFDQLRAWGDTIWQLWNHNKDLPGAAPFQMATASVGVGSLPVVRLTTDQQTVSEDAGSVIVTAELTATTDLDVTVPFAVGGTATGGGVDHNLASGSFSITAGDLIDSVIFQVTGDSLYERSETVVVTLGEPVNATLGVPHEQTITINDDDDPPLVSFSQPAYSESEGAASAIITVTLSAESSIPASVQYATGDGTATAGADYVAVSDSLSFAPGVLTQTFVIPLLDDDLIEGDETVLLSLADPVSATLGTAGAQLTIVDDEGPPTLSISDASAGENDGEMVFDVTLSAASELDVSVDYVTVDGPAGPGGATAGADYTGVSGTLDIPAGLTQGQISVPVLQDAFYEGSEVFSVELGNPANAGLGDVLGQGTILDDESPPVISFERAEFSVDEGVAGGSAAITVTLTGATALTATVDYEASDGTAGPGDYAAISGTLVFTPGVSTRTFEVSITDDALYELDESVLLALDTASNAQLDLSSATLTIHDDDSPPVISFSDLDYFESEGAASATITVTLAGGTALAASVQYATADGSATDGADYTAASGTLLFAPGVITQTFVIPLLDDGLVEGSETVLLSLAGPVEATLGAAGAELTIIDDEGPPTLSISDASAGESDGEMVFDVTLSTASELDVSVDYVTSDGPAGPGGATAGADYTGVSGTLDIPAGLTQGQISVPVLPDGFYEGNEVFSAELSNPSNAGLGDALGQGTIVDDESPPVISFEQAQYTVDEGPTGGSAGITVTLTGATALTATVDYEASDGTAGPADYTAMSGTLVFTPGISTRAFAIAITDDALDELDETVLLALDTVSNADLGLSSATLTIQDDDQSPQIFIGDASIIEADAALLFPVSLSAPSSFDIEVSYTTSDGAGASGATAGADYEAAGGVLVIPAGASSASVTVDILDDALYELVEIFQVELSDAVNATISDAEAVGTILNSDLAPQIQFEAAAYSVGEEAGTVTLTVTLSGPTAVPAMIAYATADGPPPDGAVQGEDYVQAGDTITFLPGETSQVIVLTILDDTQVEVTETFELILSGPSHSTIGAQNPAIVEIIDGDPLRLYLPLLIRQAAP